MFIYKITNVINGKVYIGSTKNEVKLRWAVHKHNAFNKEPKSDLHNDMKLLGIDSFLLETIAECKNQLEMERMEYYYIEKFKTYMPYGYNKNGRALNPKTFALKVKTNSKFL